MELFGNTSSSSLTGVTQARRDYDRVCDEETDICEEMFSMRANNHDADIEAHYGWDHMVSYDSHSYSDKEN